MTVFQHAWLACQFGSMAIEERVTEIALLSGNPLPHYHWEHGGEIAHGNTHRLILHTQGHEAHLDFTERELVACTLPHRHRAIDRRMYSTLQSLS